MRALAFVLAVGAAGLVACPPVVVWQSVGTTSACQHACDVAAEWCPEGRASDCVASFTSWDQGPARIRRPDTGTPLTCVSVGAATSAAQLQAMGMTCVGPADAGAE